MTCIAYRDGVLAGDSRLACGSSVLGEMTKIAKGKDGAVGGAAGDASFISAWVAWVAEGRSAGDPRPLPEKEGGSALLVYPDGRIEVTDHGGPFFIDAPYWVVGCGRAEATGALYAGADAETAVRAACAHDAYCGGAITVLKLGKGA